MNSKKNFEGIDVFSVNQLEKNVIFIDWLMNWASNIA